MNLPVNLRELIEELVGAWQAGDAHRAAAFFAPAGVYHESGREPIAGRESIFAHFARFFRDGPAWRFEIAETIVEGERAAVAYRFEINTGGTWRASDGFALVRSKDGLVTLWREYHA
ncbi:MAG TPA: nuclear transport factor 2 family protein [Candidatus Acidoferrales bacterium]|nr:nuclear transport factor 2 family protein [Candidatus Acidoferrales bacterium]